jgi:hypothetical protein
VQNPKEGSRSIFHAREKQDGFPTGIGEDAYNMQASMYFSI